MVARLLQQRTADRFKLVIKGQRVVPLFRVGIGVDRVAEADDCGGAHGVTVVGKPLRRGVKHLRAEFGGVLNIRQEYDVIACFGKVGKRQILAVFVDIIFRVGNEPLGFIQRRRADTHLLERAARMVVGNAVIIAADDKLSGVGRSKHALHFVAFIVAERFTAIDEGRNRVPV